jgi:periplasmic divalent cation tolerance protein
MSIVICLVTAPSPEVGAALAKSLVDQRLAACVNIVPAVQSIYRWQDEITIDEEVLLLIKTEKDLTERLKQAVMAAHPYEVPEFVALLATDVSTAYAEWIKSSVG